MLPPWSSGATATRVLVSVALAMLVVGGEQAASQEELADPTTLCQRFPERPECAIRAEQQASGREPSTPTPKPRQRRRPTPPQPTPADPGACAAAEDAASGAARTGSTGTPTRICNCQKAQGTVRRYLRSPVDRSDQSPVIEVCETVLDYRLDGVLVIPKDANHPSFAQAALDDLSAIASVSDPSGNVGFEFLLQLVRALGNSTPRDEQRSVYVRWGTVPMRGKSGKTTPFTRPGSSADPPTNAEWQAATALGLDVYARDGVPVGGNKQYFGGLLKGTGAGVGSTIYYQPETLPDPTSCPSGMTPDVALLHELEHAARIARGQVDNTPYSNLWLTRDPLASSYGVHEEKFVVERENEYRAALEQQHPKRNPKLRQRKSYFTDC